MESQIYPWNQKQWQQMISAFESGRMPHAILLQGAKGLGKFEFARSLSTYMLCGSKLEGEACGTCHTCKLLRADTHPDYKEILPANEGKSILVDQVRGFCDFFVYSSQLSLYKTGVICPADKMNRNASNSLLKTLEEPTKNSLIVLVAESTTNLPATVRSRCQVIEFNPPTHDEAVGWISSQGDYSNIDLALSLADSSPVEAKRYLDSDYLQQRENQFALFEGLRPGKVTATAAAEKLSKVTNRRTIGWVLSWIEDMIKLKMLGNVAEITNFDLVNRLGNSSKNISISSLYSYYDKISASISLIDRQANLQLVLEDLFVSWLYLDK